MSRRPSKRAVARALGVALSSLQHQITAGHVTWPPASVDAARAQWLSATNAQGPAPLVDRGGETEGETEGESLADARRRKERALADLRELELARERGELCLAAEVGRGLADAFGIARSRLLALPSQIAQAGVPREAVVIAERVVRETLEELAQGPKAITEAARKAAQR